ncbi:MAG: acyl-CoA dehydrogenase family protein [Deltaproteobacteria bacterium]|nr:acyl-CoA dehydrogenase family protein [Deltaproteobacteria bacterium]
MANYFTDNDDLQWQYQHGLQWDELARTSELDYTLPGGHKNLKEARAFYDEVMNLVGDIAANELAPRAAAIDRKGTHLENGKVVMPKESDEVLQKFKEAGLLGMTLPRELGGSNCPLGLSFVANEVLSRADVSTMSHIGFHNGSGMALLAYSALEGSVVRDPQNPFLGKTRWDKEIQEIAEGKAWGCMVLTEPDCGSDLGAMRTTGTLKDGKWYLNGNKIFITSGHGQYQIVIARTEEKKGDGALDGLKGLSLFMCRREIERDGKKIQNVKIDKVEHKMGHNGSPTCSLVYEDSEAELIGKRGQGFELMLFMMNGARVAVGFEGVGVCEAAYRQATEYAKIRKTMGKAIIEHEMVAEMLMDMDLDIRGMRAMAFQCINYSELSTKYDLILRYAPPKDPAEAERIRGLVAKYKKRARDLTPLLKYVAAEKAVEHARKNMQIHGGAGYMQEFGAEKIMRDALVIPVYEGTSQIQALMVLKDRLMSVLKAPTKFAKQMSLASIGATTAKTELERNVHQGRVEVSKVITHLIGRVAGNKVRKEIGQALRDMPAHEWPRYLTQDFMRDWDLKADFSYGLLHAERLTKMLVDVEIATILAKQAAMYPERKKLAERYARRMMPRIRHMADEIRTGDTSVLEWIDELAAREVSADAETKVQREKRVA